jgi:hypothetical protein
MILRDLQNKNPGRGPQCRGWGFYFANPEDSFFTRRKNRAQCFWMNYEKVPPHWMNYKKNHVQRDYSVIKNPEEFQGIKTRKVHVKFCGRFLRIGGKSRGVIGGTLLVEGFLCC